MSGELNIKRLDTLYPEAPGNKYFKLKYNLLKAQSKGVDRIVTVGGPWSNHLHATALSCQKEGIPCVGLVHGNKPPTLSPTLKDCQEAGMELQFLDRTWYAERTSEAFKAWVNDTFSFCYFIPEGGRNYLGLNGCMEILKGDDKTFSRIAVSVGTGTTLAGLLLSAAPQQTFLAFPALKDDTLEERIKEQLYWATTDMELAEDLMNKVTWVNDYTFGGFAKSTPELIDFIRSKEKEGIPLDLVYTAKMIFGLEDLARKGDINLADVLAVHTGGLQGNRSIGWTPH
ncbi:MAG: pyridoxal-phosphate dependent enzyme [Flavobacteriales bacterium]|nr:pyridoxal-phosphate dependent enzyme [Flavobacteriales bacterium]MDG1780756.1 pyridoxal-phosphate dependent enzyme [Flavobacteriales bacterium]MDG2244723.1 pyridoxal-phosphate dependent enzyme [Flavobacteriales bacterium]